MTQEEKNEFDCLNSSSYLLRLLLDRKGFEITKNASGIWHVFYDGHIVGSLTYRHDDDYDYTFTNLRLYKYLIHKVPKLKDFIMSEYFEHGGNKLLRFDSDGFNKYLDEIIEVFSPKHVKTEDATSIMKYIVALFLSALALFYYLIKYLQNKRGTDI